MSTQEYIFVVERCVVISPTPNDLRHGTLQLPPNGANIRVGDVISEYFNEAGEKVTWVVENVHYLGNESGMNVLPGELLTISARAQMLFDADSHLVLVGEKP